MEAAQRSERYEPTLRSTAKKLYLTEGLSLRDVAVEMGISKTRVLALLDEAGVERRTKKEAFEQFKKRQQAA